MAFHIKTDYCGLVAATTPSGQSATPCLVLRDDNENGSTDKYRPNGQNGGYVALEVYGEDSAPDNSYGLKKKITAAAGAIKLGSVTSVTEGEGQSAVTKKYALEKVSISTGGAQITTIKATSQEVESDCDAATMPYFTVPAFELDKAQIAQDIFDAINLTGTGCELTKVDIEMSCAIGKDKVAGLKISSDVNSGIITVKGTILQTGSTKPTIAVATGNTDGWKITQQPTRKNPESAYKEYEFEMELILEKTYPTANQGGGSST